MKKKAKKMIDEYLPDAISCWVKDLPLLCPDMLGKLLQHGVVV